MKLAQSLDRLGTETAFQVLARAEALQREGRSIINLGIGQQTPPVASVVLITCAIAKISLAAIIPSMLWFIAAMLVALLLVNAFPFLSLWLPALIV